MTLIVDIGVNMVDINIDGDKPVVIEPEKKEIIKETIIIKEPKKRRRKTKPIVKNQTIVIQRPQKRKKTKKVKIVKKIDVNKKHLNDLMTLVKANQKLVYDMVKINADVMDNVVKLSSSVASLTDSMNGFLSKERKEELPSSNVPSNSNEMDERLRRLETKLNNIITNVSRKR